MALTNEFIQEKIKTHFSETEMLFEESFGMQSITLSDAAFNLKLLQFLYDDAALQFQFLTDLTGIHYPDNKGKELGVIYHLHSLINNTRLRVKIFVPIEKPDVFTATQLFSGANWMERETFDFYGINFVGHPNLIRILNVDEMNYHPMRKEYPMEDPTRIDKDDAMFGR